MSRELVSGLNGWQLTAAIAHAVALGLAQWGLNYLCRRFGLDRFSVLTSKSTRKAIQRTLLTRFSFWLWTTGLYTFAVWHLRGPLDWVFGPGWAWSDRPRHLLTGFTVIAVFSLLGRLLYLTNRQLRVLASSDASHWEHMAAVFAADALQVGLPLGSLFFVLPQVGLPAGFMASGREVVNTLIILAGGYVVCRQVNLAADKIILVHRTRGGVDLRSRTLYTEVSALRKVIIACLVFLTVALAMLFCAPLRQIGTSLLASAGLLSVVVGVAAQRSLGQLIAGFQLALTQPILLDDVIVVGGENGRVEEITLGYVVVHLWDQRRLIVPISQFLEKPFENWTRRTPEMLGTVLLHFDYQLPLEVLRAEMDRFLDAHPLWDGRTRNLQVTDARENCLQFRALVSAADPDKLWTLRCDLRAALVRFVRESHPSCLVRTRLNVEALPEPDRQGVDGAAPRF